MPDTPLSNQSRRIEKPLLSLPRSPLSHNRPLPPPGKQTELRLLHAEAIIGP